MHDEDVTGDLSGTYLKKADFDNGDLVFAVASVDKVAFEPRNGRPAEKPKWTLTFDTEPVRKMSLNKTNLALMSKAYGKRTGAWVHQAVEIFWDESVSFGGQLVGGMRIRLPKRRPATPVANGTDPELGI